MICRFPVELDRVVNGKHHIIYVPCGKCVWCLRQKRNEWFVRMLEESKVHLFTRFVTLDYDDEHLPLNIDQETGEVFPTVSLRDIQLYHKRLRKDFNFRFFLASEYGSKRMRPHYHAIYWSDHKIPFLDYWKNGSCGADLPAKPGSFKYVTKYILKGSLVLPGGDDNFHVMSRRPGIGSNFMKNVNDNTRFYRYFDSVMKLPSYYSRKFNDSLSDSQLSVLSEQKLDYLSSQGKYESLLNTFVENAPENQSIDDWMNDLYRRDYKKQISINKKS